MSRRDEVVDTLDSLVSNFRTQLATAIQHPDTREFNSVPSTPNRSRAPSLVSRLSSLLDLPNLSPPASPSLAHASRAGESVPFSSSRHTSIPLPPPHQSSSAPPHVPYGDDALPTYSRRPPVSPDLLESLPSKRLHLLSSRTGKLQLELAARGQQHVILIQEQPDGPTDLTGTLKLVLKGSQPEHVTHLKIRLKGIVRSLVMKAHASGRHPVSDEVTFLESSQTLYDSSSGEAFLPSNESPDPTKLLGSFEFPFALQLPARITHYTPTTLPGNQTPIPLSRPIRPPPSFMLESNHHQSSSSPKDNVISTQSRNLNGENSGGGFEVSCRYFIKVTLGRKGLLKLNERWIIPVVFVPRQQRPSFSIMRELAIDHFEHQLQQPHGARGGDSNLSLRVPHSDQDPDGWTEEGKYRMKRTMKKPYSLSSAGWGLRRNGHKDNLHNSSGVANIEIEGKTIRGNKVERGDAGSPGGNGIVPFEVRVKTSQVGITGKFKPNMINVFLVQRTAITAQRLTNAQDVVVSRATSMHPFGTTSPEGEPFNNGAGWTVKFGGNIKLPPQLGVSFKAPNLSVTYVLCFSVNVGGISNDLSPLAIPIELVNCPPRRSASAAALPIPSSPPPPISPLPPAPVELPPAPSTTLKENGSENRNGGAAAPPLPPRHPSTATGLHPFSSRPSTSHATLPSDAIPGDNSSEYDTGRIGETPSINGSNGSPRIETREREEAELEAVYGLPPSYFDTVGMDQSHNPMR